MMSSGVYSVFLANTAKIKMTSVSMRYKVSRGAISTAGVIAHLRYIDRNGRLEIETDEGDHLKGKGIEKDLTDDWDLDSANAQCRGPYRGKAGRKPARLVHNVILSMPKGTPPEKLLLASRDFAREQFALKHRYALAIHTDQDHPHVHLVVRAVSEDGKRLNIRKATLREWRGLFAQHLRAHGIAANATERAVRGQTLVEFQGRHPSRIAPGRFPISARAHPAYCRGAS